MGQLYDLRVQIETKIKADRLDAMAIKGKIDLSAGRILALISPTTQDDPKAIAKLRRAAKEVLKLNL